jgi:phage replication-related protein YjqB (UPF0714/DUF867 family)
MSDKYANFEALRASEPKDAYAICFRDANSPIVVVAPHGGGIEPGTSEIALSIAGEMFSYYLFEGKKARGNAELHITSANFDEPQCLALLRATRIVVTVHGEGSDSETVYLGGRHTAAKAAVCAALEMHAFDVREHENSQIQGAQAGNICNAGLAGQGLQFELSRGLRSSFFHDLTSEGRKKPTPLLTTFSAAVQNALKEIEL